MLRVLSLLLAPVSLFAATVAVPRAPGIPSYQVELTSTADGATWTGRETVAFTNTSSDPLPEVYLRLWGNARGCGAVKVAGTLAECTVDR